MVLEEKRDGLGKGVGSGEGVECLDGLGVLVVGKRGKNHSLRPSLVFHLHTLEGGETLGFLLGLELLALPLPILAPALDKVEGVSLGIDLVPDGDAARCRFRACGSCALRCPAHGCI